MKSSTIAISCVLGASLAAMRALPAQNVLHVHIGDAPFTGFGHSVADAGDVDGDGHADVLVGAPNDPTNAPSAGMARVHSGNDGSALHTFHGAAPYDLLGAAVAGAGDVDGDGWADVVVGAPAGSVSVPDAGLVQVFSGQTGLAIHVFEGDSTDDRFGTSVAAAGDGDGDGFVDLVVGAPEDDDNGPGSGSARVFSGATGVALHTFFGDSAGDALGRSVGGGGDVDGDGLADVIAGAPGDDNTAAEAGSARVFSVAGGAVLHTFDGDGAADRLGHAVAGAGDANGDGRGDLLAGAPFDDDAATDAGSVRVHSGLTGAVLFTFDGLGAHEHFGAAASGAGDVDADGRPDVIAGGFFVGDLTPPVRARVFSGADGTELHRVEDPQGVDAFGWSVGGGGDVNADGFADFLVGVFDIDFSPGGSSVRVYSGKPAVRAFGAGCNGHAAAWQGAAVVGTSDLTIGLTGAAPSTPCALGVGLSDAVWLGVPLPLPLDAVGAPGCTLYVSLDAVVPTVTDGAGAASLSIPVPASPSLVGLVGFAQWTADYPGANALGLSLSGALEITVQSP